MKFKPSKYNIPIKSTRNYTYLYNTFSGSLCKFDKKTEQIINNVNSMEEKDIPYFNDLLKQGFIVNESIDEFNRVIFRQNVRIFEQNPTKLSFVIAPTIKCNLSCVYCFEACSNKNDGFDDEIIDNVINYIKNLIIQKPSIKYLSVDWFGGEPLLKFDQIRIFSKKIKQVCAEHNIAYSACMITNGVLLTKDKAKILKEECNVKSVQITLDGMEETYCKFKRTTKEIYNKVIQNILDIYDILSVQIRLNTNKQNYEDIKKLAKYLLIDLNLTNKIRIYLAELKYFEGYTVFEKESCLESKNFANVKIDFLNYIKNELNIKDFKFSYTTPKIVACGLCINTNSVIGPNGELYRCEHHIGKQDKIIGTCTSGRFFTDTDMQFMLPAYQNKCKKCVMFPTCFCGCKNDLLANGLRNQYCKSMKKELIALLKQKIIDKENNIASSYGIKR